jgi:hypothetical protein
MQPSNQPGVIPAHQAAEKLNSEGDGGFNPRVGPIESTRAGRDGFEPIHLSTEGRFSGNLPENQPLSAASYARLR